MADVYEIAERVVDMHKHTPGCSVVPCPCTTCKLARHVLATRGVVEAADGYEKAYMAFEDIEPVGGVMVYEMNERREAMHDKHHELIAAVRAMKEKRDHE